jgi:lysophospholipase L1-like esterase
MRAFSRFLPRMVGIPVFAVAVALGAGVGTAAAHPAAAHTTTGAPWYLALGDSLSQGVQPNLAGTDVTTDQGYANDIYNKYKKQIPGLELRKMGCPGETTGTMVAGGICSYPLGSQLAQAVNFISHHNVALVTIDIGANNVDNCIVGTSIDLQCIAAGVQAAETQLPEILTALRTAAGPAVPIVGMNYYDPYLALWLTGTNGQALAQASESLAVGYNHALATIYKAFQDPVANVQATFVTKDFKLTKLGIPVNVQRVCLLTYMCAPAPTGPNIHANLIGYRVITFAFEQVIGDLGASG